jgi:diadenosine tetraphosphatase ApaH/serine/threonine PP2A family protein phosphatase
MTVLEDAKPFERVWCLGDVVGYGPDPNACIERLRELPGLKCVKGNHDAAILGDIDKNAFNYEARASLTWLESNLKPQNRRWLETLEERLTIENITLVHGSPRNPIWEYVMDLSTAQHNLSAFDTQFCLVGHTHIPCVFQMRDEEDINSTRLYAMSPDVSFKLERRAIVNPGSVGQPRDRDPRASYLIFDSITEQWTYHRVDYAFEEVQERILAAGLPSRHASRLQSGL